MEDIEFKTTNKKFKCRVNGLIINDGKILTLRMKNNTSYCLPGGHVELCENSKDAILREMFEETKTNVSIEKEFAIVENFYIDKNNLDTHELSFYYIVTPENFDKIKFENYSLMENDKGELKQHNFEWLDISTLNNVDFRPPFIKDKLISGNYNFEHIIITK
ncbi:MAG: NUDIX domain-containing protein [Bacilli bacterium]|nr:NUDIX domain-containing protein [Bacilli bacterium]